MDGQETAVRYWQNTVKDVIDQYLVEFPNGVKRSYIYSHLPKNSRTDTMLAGLCNICDDAGYENFNNLVSLVDDISKKTLDSSLKTLPSKIRDFQRYLKTQFSEQVSILFVIACYTMFLLFQL